MKENERETLLQLRVWPIGAAPGSATCCSDLRPNCLIIYARSSADTSSGGRCIYYREVVRSQVLPRFRPSVRIQRMPNTMAANEKTLTSYHRHHHHHRLPEDDVSMTSHRHHYRRSSLRRYMVSPIVCLLLCVLVNPVLLEVPRARSHYYFRHNPRSSSEPSSLSSRRGNASSVASLEDDRRFARYSFPLAEPVRPSTTTPTTTTTRRPSLRKILEGEDDEELTRRRPQARSHNDNVQRQLMPIVARIRVEPVAAAEFRRRLKTARSYRDVVRIFIRSEERLRDEDIDDFIASPLMTSAAENASNGIGAAQSIIVGSSGRQSIEDNRLPTNEWELTLQHYNEMQNIGECRHPIPKFIQVRHHEMARPESDYLPECTVVYRCHKELGCCNSTSECGVKTSTYIYRSFWEITCLPNSNCSEYPLPVVKTYQFVNHTECECKPIKHLPRCLPCPIPFEIGGSREDFSRCNCTCDADNQHCLEISSGIMPLAADEINCIRESTCERPFCANGEYDVDTGYCPCPEDTPDCRSNHQSQGQGNEDDDDDDDDNDGDYLTADETVANNTEQPTTEGYTQD